MNVPTLEELFEKFRKVLNDPDFVSNSESFETHFRRVASGGTIPVLTLESAVFAARCVVVILEHVKAEKGGEA